MKKNLAIICVGACCIPLLMFAFLPRFFSSPVVLNALIERLTSGTGGTLEVEQCRIGWQEGLVCSEVTFTDSSRGVQVYADQVSGSRGLLPLLAAPGNFGTLYLLHPVVTLNKHRQLAQTVFSAISSPEKKLAPVALVEDTPFWDSLTGTLVLKDGRVRLLDSLLPGTIQDAVFSGSFSLDAGTIQYEFSGSAGEGTVMGKGFVNLPARRQNILDTLVVRLQLQINNLQVAPLLSLTAASANVPVGRALLNGDLTMTTAGRDAFDVIGTLDGKDIELSDGFLGEDQIRMKSVSFDLDGSIKGRDNWRIARCDVTGDAGQLAVSGSYEQKKGEVRVSGTLDLPVLCWQFPHLLHLRDGVSITGGQLKFFFEQTRDNAQQEVISDAVIDSLQGSLNGEQFSWESPVSFSLSGNQDEDESFLKRFNVSSSFLQAEGKGSPDDFSFTLDTDLEKMDHELGWIFLLPWQGRGEVSLQAISGVYDANRYAVDFQIRVPKFSLLRNGSELLPEHPLRMDGHFFFQEERAEERTYAGLQLDGDFWPGSFSLTLSGIKRAASIVSAEYAASARMQLDRLSAFLQADAEKSESMVSGELNVDAVGFVAGDQLVLRELDARMTDCAGWGNKGKTGTGKLILQTQRFPVGRNIPVAASGLQVFENSNEFQDNGYGLSSYDLAGGRLFVRNMGLHGASINLDIAELVIADVKIPNTPWRAVLEGQKKPLSPVTGAGIRDELKKLFSGCIAREEL